MGTVGMIFYWIRCQKDAKILWATHYQRCIRSSTRPNVITSILTNVVKQQLRGWNTLTSPRLRIIRDCALHNSHHRSNSQKFGRQPMLEFAWWWALFLLPLPILVRYLVPAKPQHVMAALQVPALRPGIQDTPSPLKSSKIPVVIASPVSYTHLTLPTSDLV